MKTEIFVPLFSNFIPDKIEDGRLYISDEFEVAVHLCACGCGGKTVTSLKSGEWSVTKNDGKITLRPSIGNFSGQNPFHAHYYITDNRVEWC